MAQREPDLVIRPDGLADYVRRWWWLGHNLYFDIYFHLILRSDDDRALHDHPRPNISIIARGEYIEHTIAQGGVHYAKKYQAGDIRFRWATTAHRLELAPGMEVITLWIVGPEHRRWGFHFKDGWKDSSEVTVMEKGVGKRMAVSTNKLLCPPDLETATGTFDPAGYDANDCAGCGASKSDHLQGPPVSRNPSDDLNTIRKIG